MGIEDLVLGLQECFRDKCGLAAAIDLPFASEIVRDMLWVQQHRGDAGAGIISSNHQHLHIDKGKGTVRDVFPQDYPFKKKLPGKVAIGHTRYATSGSANARCNVQPLVFTESKYGEFAIGHNGQLVDKKGVKKRMISRGALFQSNSDSETIAHLIASSDAPTLEEAIISQVPQIPAAYSLLIMTKQKVFALRDRFGVRPLSLAKYKDSYLIASETSAFRIFDDAEESIEVNPGEMVIFDKMSVRSGKGFESVQFANPSEMWCIFEGIYFSSPRSKYRGYVHEDFRQDSGKVLYYENSEFFEWLKNNYEEGLAVVPILDSGKQGAIGFCKASNVPYKEYFLRRHNSPKAEGRSYTSSTQEEREIKAMMKLDLRKEKINSKAIITIDDSIVRGTTSRANNGRLRKAGAEHITNVILSPKIISPCFMGMDHQTYGELMAYNHKTEEEIAKELGSDRVIYLSLEGLRGLVKETYDCGVCTGCFGGDYPVKNRRITTALKRSV